MRGARGVDLIFGAEEWLTAFLELSTDRHFGMRAGPLPSASIDRWIDRNGIGQDEEQAFRACMRAMDKAYREGLDSSGDKVSNRPLTPALFGAMFSKG